VEKRERQDILGVGGVRDATDREAREAAVLETDLEGSPLRGRPLRRRLRNFRPSIESYVASLGGPLAYMQRLREIETLTAAHERDLDSAWREAAAESGGDPARFERRWRRTAERWNFWAVNDLIDRHNRFYPAESRLPMDPRTGDFALVAGHPYRRAPLDAAWILERFPPDLHAAAA
jgi:hypothetical protein